MHKNDSLELSNVSSEKYLIHEESPMGEALFIHTCSVIYRQFGSPGLDFSHQ